MRGAAECSAWRLDLTSLAAWLPRVAVAVGMSGELRPPSRSGVLRRHRVIARDSLRVPTRRKTTAYSERGLVAGVVRCERLSAKISLAFAIAARSDCGSLGSYQT